MSAFCTALVRPNPASWESARDTSIGLDVFCDWLTIYQDHHGADLPVLNDGYVVRFEHDAFGRGIDQETGEIRPMFDASKAEYTVARRFEHEGSYDTHLSVRCDGTRVELSGNVGRFGRPDNLFGLPVLETIERANAILAVLGLPPFTHMERNGRQARNDGFHTSHNAVITRVDLTANFSAGDREAAFRVLHLLGGQATVKKASQGPKGYANGVTWNEGSKRHYEKLYYKADELGKHVSDEVREYCESAGILRYEVSLKSRELLSQNLQSMVSWSKVVEGKRMENVVYGRFSEVLTRNQVSVTEVHDIPGKLGLIARSYLNGENPYKTLMAGASTIRRWRKELLAYGIDISQPCDVRRVATRIRVVDLVPLNAPAWYSREAA